MVKMRAKLRLSYIKEYFYGESGAKSGELLDFYAVAASKYPNDGSDENNTYAKFSPSAKFEIQVCNPALFDKFKVGEEYYVDFTLATPVE